MCREQQRQLTVRPIFRFTRQLRQLLAKNDTCYLPASPHWGGRNVGCFNTAPAKLYDGYDRHHVGCYRRRGQSSPARDSCPLYVQGF